MKGTLCQTSQPKRLHGPMLIYSFKLHLAYIKFNNIIRVFYIDVISNWWFQMTTHLHIRFCSQMMSVIQQPPYCHLHLTSILTRLISLTVTEGNKHLITRKHSSRMRTVRCQWPSGVGVLPGGYLSGGRACLPGRCLPRGVSAWRISVPTCTG